MAKRYEITRNSLKQTLLLWVLSNLGGTLILAIKFSLGRLDDALIALVSGGIAALLSLFVLPLWVPFFSAINCVECRRVQYLVMLSGSVLFYFIANILLLYCFPLGSLDGVMELTFPYLLSAFVTITYLYRIVLPLPVGPPNIDYFSLTQEQRAQFFK
ncbi:hypothetical protein [Hymenobacter crusticola]|uniref:Uncharacterized protein n=1 Tax=Hymenobacter crusticola TaxID=1770526 RepID=A0A243WI02_9BACT|nr:hypothetical protein [Hymenobacter crusticola]OUJ75447.1 hypothetical protein BXP70_05390 [Hymenobacter crusticola]